MKVDGSGVMKALQNDCFIPEKYITKDKPGSLFHLKTAQGRLVNAFNLDRRHGGTVYNSLTAVVPNGSLQRDELRSK